MNAAPGDVFEIRLDDGFGYVQLRACHAVYGDILDVDMRKYEVSPQDPERLVFSKTVIFPLRALSNGSISGSLTGHQRLKRSGTPEFKFAVRDGSGDPIYWWTWNGNSISPAAADQDLDHLPERRVLTATELLALW